MPVPKKPRLRNFLVHQIPGTGEEEDEYNDCDKVTGSRIHGYGQDRKEHHQDQEGCKSDDNIKKSFVHYCKFSLPEDIGLSDFFTLKKASDTALTLLRESAVPKEKSKLEKNPAGSAIPIQ